jgi:hypothetical protein
LETLAAAEKKLLQLFKTVQMASAGEYKAESGKITIQLCRSE